VPGPGGAPGGPVVAVLVEPSRTRSTRELLGAAAGLAQSIEGHVVAIGPTPGDAARLAAWGADAVIAIHGSEVEEDIARAVTEWCATNTPWAVLAPSTPWGREVLSRAASVLQAGVTGDAVGLLARDGRLIADKPAFGGALIAEISCSSAIQMATVRAGVLPLLTPREAKPARVSSIEAIAKSRVRIIDRSREDDSDEMVSAPFVIGVGKGVDPADYLALDEIRDSLGAVYCATRKVTDEGWMPRARQVGITGHSISPHLYIAIGLSGNFNHTAGVRSSGTIIAVNKDPDAEIFQWADVGFVGDWKTVLGALAPALALALAE
jgi:electron transfer flavoprotein alpha subunit